MELFNLYKNVHFKQNRHYFITVSLGYASRVSVDLNNNVTAIA